MDHLASSDPFVWIRAHLPSISRIVRFLQILTVQYDMITVTATSKRAFLARQLRTAASC
jgi:hypothetical protein